MIGEIALELALATIGVGLLAWWWIWHRRHVARLHYHEVPDELLRFVPPSLHPEIDPAICIGSAACAAACPEGDILGLHRGRALLVQPSACIGHGECAAECPVGAIRLVFGSAERGVDIPHVTGHFETNVPGVFIVGELGGMGLIRNAVTQATEAIEYIAKQGRSREAGVADLLVIGAGPAGLAASLMAKKLGLACITIDQDTLGGTINSYPRRKVVMLAPVDMPYYGRIKERQMLKEELLAVFEKATLSAGISIMERTRLLGLSRTNGHFTAQTSAGDLQARRVVLAIGRRGTPKKLGVPGEDLPKVAYSLKEAEAFAGCRVLVVGGGDSAIEAAVMLAEAEGTTVTLSYRRATFDRAKPKNIAQLEAKQAEGRIEVVRGSQVTAIGPESVELDCGGSLQTVPNDQVFVFAGGELPTPLLNAIGVSMERKFGTA